MEKLLELLYRFGFSGVLYGIAARYLLQFFETGEGMRQALLFGLFGSVAVAFSQATKNFVKPIAEAFGKPVTDFTIGKIELLYLWLTSRFQKDYYKYLIDEHGSYQTQGLTKGAIGLELAKMFVPLQVIPQNYDDIAPHLIQQVDTPEKQTIWDYLAASEKYSAYRRIALIAPPGSGKTILLKHLALTYAQNGQRRYSRKAPRLIPVLLHLRKIQKTIQQTQPRLDRLIESQDTVQQKNPRPDWFHQKLTDGDCLIMLDGLDEVPDAERQAVSRWIDRQIEQYRSSRFILTSRPLSFEGAPVQQIDSYLQVKPFDFKQMETFLSKWYVQNARAKSAQTMSFRSLRQRAYQKTADLMYRIRHDDALARLALNPLLLTMIATIDDSKNKALPLHRASLYQEICDVLLVRRQASRGIDHSLAEVTQQVLQHMALAMMDQGTTELDMAADHPQSIQKTLQKVLEHQPNLEDLLNQTDSASGLLIRTDDSYAFVHQVFQIFCNLRWLRPQRIH